MEIKIKSNSKEVIKDLVNMQKVAATTTSIISSTNTNSEKSYKSLKNQLSSVDSAYNQLGNTMAMIANQANLVSATVNSMSQSLAMSTI